MFGRLVEALHEQQRAAEVGVRAGGIGALRDCDEARGVALLDTICVEQCAAQIEVGIPRLRIERDDVAEQGDLVAVDAGLAPGRPPEHGENDDERARGRVSQRAGQAVRAAHGTADQHRHHPDAGQVLEAIGDE